MYYALARASAGPDAGLVRALTGMKDENHSMQDFSWHITRKAAAAHSTPTLSSALQKYTKCTYIELRSRCRADATWGRLIDICLFQNWRIHKAYVGFEKPMMAH